ncbi:ankyrin repeat-containing domain protein [Rhodocollybia butyracea]|uniref:Ankyrin repeat-containing domain protein n=1 Tax=Rhodocollybia butyracea TaxID=206335 RepID=A0A9P5PMC6_9AGAR|nr:ankyrin repeat-containing domain protein [Rhodocollybia butyracea]
MTEPSLRRDFGERQSNLQAGADTPGRVVGASFDGASNFSMVNPQFQAATNIQNNYLTWNTNDVSDIRKWLKAPDPSTNFVAACKLRTLGTGDWIFSDPQFVKWRQAKSGVLWIQGKVGSGKTLLSTAIIDQLRGNPALLCCYYYFDNRDNSQTKTNAQGLLQSLLVQTATRQGKVHPALHELYKSSNQGLMEPTIGELSATLELVSKDLNPVYLVLDAMDECSEAIDVLKHLAQLKKHTCIAVTSRYLAEREYDVSWSIHLDDTRYFRQDVDKYLKDKFSHRKLGPKLLTEIVNQLSQDAQGQFRWVDCQVTVLQRCKTPKAMREALNRLPKTLAETYTLAIERMREGEHVLDAGKLLMWLAYAFEPLSIAQVTDILAIDLEDHIFDPEMRSLELENGTYEILDSTLITVDVEKVVKLAHNSVKEFLTETHAEVHISKGFKINEHLAHSTICQTCLIYLLQFNKEGMLPKEEYMFKKLYPLGLYAAQHWPKHMERLVDERPEHKHTKDLAISLLKDNSQLPYVNWIRIHVPDQSFWMKTYEPILKSSQIQSQLYYMASLNMRSIAEHLLAENLADVNWQGGEHGNALQVACWRGHRDIIQFLLEHKVDVNAQGAGHYGNALQAAACSGRMDIIQLLLEHKADVNAQGGHYGNALLAAINEAEEDIVQLLLEHKADLNVQGPGTYGNALQAAAWRGNKDVILLLLEHKADINAQVGHYGNVLQVASWRGNKDIVQLLLEHRADVNAQGGYYGNALQSASQSGNKDIVELLLEHNADVNAQGGEYGNALQGASWKGNKNIVQLLLEHNADIHAKGGYYGNALQAASWRANKDIVQLLLVHKADVNAQGGYYGNALVAAISQREKDIVHLLLEHKADVNAQGGPYGNALQAAISQGGRSIVHLLLEHKADVNATGGHEENALLAAISARDKDIVQLLLEYKADVNATGGRYGNALLAAIHERDKDIVQLLLEYKVDLNPKEGHHRNALLAAINYAGEDIVQLLLPHKLDANVQRGEHRNPSSFLGEEQGHFPDSSATQTRHR